MGKKAKTEKPGLLGVRAPGPLPPEFKVRVLEEAARGTSQELIARVFGVSVAAITKWKKQYKDHGLAGLENRGRGEAKPKTPSPKTVSEERVVALKQENEDWGTRRIRDALRRFEALGISETEVRRILHEAG